MNRPSLLLLPLLLGALPASAACPLTASTPVKFEPPSAGTYPGVFVPGFSTSLDLYRLNSGTRRLILRQNYGYSIFDLGNPNAPQVVGYQDISGSYPQDGDGSETVVNVAAAPDGSRVLVNYKQTPHGTLLMRPSAETFTFAGEFSPGRAQAGTLVDQIGTRYLGYALNQGGLYVADITTFLFGGAATTPQSIPRELVASAPGSSVPSLTRAGRFVVYSTGNAVIVVDTTLAGPVSDLSSKFTVKTLLPADLGLPPSSAISSVSAALHPLTGAMFLLVEGKGASSSETTGFVLATSADGASFSVAGPWLPPTPYSGAGSQTAGLSAIVPTADDLLLLPWARSSTGLYKLFTMSAASFGADLSPTAAWNPSLFGNDFPQPVAMRGFLTGSDLFLYVLTRAAGFTIRLTFPATAPVASSAGTVCQGQPILLTASSIPGATYAWTGPNGFVSSLQNPSIAAATSLHTGPYSVTATLAGCTSPSGLTSVLVQPPPANPSSNSPVCLGNTLQLQAAGIAGATYAWTGPNGFVSAQQNPSLPGATAAQAGTYTLTVTAAGCAGVSSTTVSTLDPGQPPAVVPPASLRVPQSACVGGAPVMTPATLATSDPLRFEDLSVFLGAGTASDACGPANRLSPQLGGVDVSETTLFPAGPSEVTFRFEDSDGNVGSATTTLTVDRHGDLDLDADVDVFDSLVLASYLVGNVVPGTPPFLGRLESADANGDGGYDVFDVVVLTGFIVGNIGCLR